MPETAKNPRKKAAKYVKVEPLTLAALLPEETSYHVAENYLTVNLDNYAWLPDSSVDLLLTDPPFNIAQDTNFHTYENNTINSYRFDKDKGWDTYGQNEFIQLMSQWATEFERVLRPGGSFAIFCADTYLSHFHDVLEAAGLNVRRTLTWRKPNAVPINRKAMMMSACEYVVIGVKGSKATFNVDLPVSYLAQDNHEVERVLVADKAASIVEKYVREAVSQVSVNEADYAEAVIAATVDALDKAKKETAARIRGMYVEGEIGKDSGETLETYLRGCVPNYVSFNSKGGNRLHPTEKPVILLRYLASLMSNPGDVILDPFGGSGSTGEASVGLGRNVIVVERDKEYFEALSQRLANLSIELVTD